MEIVVGLFDTGICDIGLFLKSENILHSASIARAQCTDARGGVFGNGCQDMKLRLQADVSTVEHM